MADARIAAFQIEVEKALSHLKTEFSGLQTGRANAALVERVQVEAYGVKQELRAIAGISVQDGRTIVIQPWDRSVLQAIEKGLSQVDLGTSPTNDGIVIRITLPPMTEERRTHLKKMVTQLSEDARIQIRKKRQELHDSFKQEKDEDVKETLQKELQKAVDDANTKIGESAKKKEDEVMKI
ncbi:MAG: ribosome recycling factor [Candidatus Peribacteraceae bacterium]|jgi:ribosome recycling factor